MYDIIQNKDSLSIGYHKKANLVIAVPLPTLFFLFFLSLAIFVDTTLFVRCVFVCMAIVFLTCMIQAILMVVKFRLLIDRNGVLFATPYKTVCMKWDDIREVAVCCSISREIVGHRYGSSNRPQTSMYFASRCLTEYEKQHFHDKRLPASVKTIFWTNGSSEEFDDILKIVSDYVQKLGDKQVLYFDCHVLKYG